MDVIGVLNVSLFNVRLRKKKCFVGMEQYLLAKGRSRIYQHILLMGNPVMSKTDITRKLSNTFTLTGLKDRAIDILVADKLLVPGNWFTSRASNGKITFHQGYLKGYPDDNPEDKARFSQILAEYSIDHEAYHYSFNNGNPFTQINDSLLPRKLTFQNISSKSWGFSQLLSDCISKSNYLTSRILLDKNAVILQQHDQNQATSTESKF